MIKSDDFILEKSYSPMVDEYNFENKQYVMIPDQQSGNYATGQTTLDCAILANSN